MIIELIISILIKSKIIMAFNKKKVKGYNVDKYSKVSSLVCKSVFITITVA